MCKRLCQLDSLEDHFNFGRYNGLTLADVLDINPSYVDWCVKECDGIHFLIGDKAISQIKIAYPEFFMSDYFVNLCKNRFSDYENDLDECEDYNNYAYEREERSSYGLYAGSYTQDEMGYSDDDIDTIFDGDPNAYWNID